MQTWMDWYVNGASRNLLESFTRFPEQATLFDPAIRRRATTDDAFAFRLSIEAAQEFLWRTSKESTDISIVPDAQWETAIWMASMAPFFLEAGRSPLAGALDREVVNELAGTRLTPEVRRYALDAVSRHGTIYLDIANRALLFGNTLQLCALFVAEAVGGTRFWAVFGEPGRNGQRRVAWFEGRDDLLTDQYHDEEFREFRARIGVPLPQFRPLIEIARDAGVDLCEVLRGLESLAYLATTYILTEMEHAGGEAWQQVPHLPAGHQRRLGRKGTATAKKFSLFRIWQVTSRHFDRGERKNVTGGWKLGHRITVSGHYRLQPFGAGRRKRRLLWIAPHQRGPYDGSPVRHIVRAGATYRREVAR